MEMAPDASPHVPDFSTLARKPSERLAIVRYVRDRPGLQETDYLEWKTVYNLSTRPEAAATSKHLIGFANRDFTLAARHAEGYAYLLLGVEPQNLVGIPIWDSADIENWLVRFVGPDLRYDVHYAELDGKQVLFLTGDPPRPGDPIYCLQKASSEPGGATLPEGTIYVRRSGKTEQAKAGDITRLTERSRAATSRLELSVELDTSGLRAISPELLTEAVRDAWITKERRVLLSTMPALSESTFGLPDVSSYLERRSRDEFQAEIEEYLAIAHDRWPSIVAAQVIEEEESVLTAAIVNDTESNFDDVVIEITLPFDATWVYTRPGAAGKLRARRPARWGVSLTESLIDMPLDIRRVDASPEPEVETVDRFVSLVRFPPIDVRPHTKHPLQRLLVAVAPMLPGQTVPVSWRATARNTPGQLRGKIDLVIPGEAVPAVTAGDAGTAEDEA